MKLLALFFFILSQAALSCQVLCCVEVVGMAEVGDFMRVKELDGSGEVKSMEALPAGTIMAAFSTVLSNPSTTNVAKIMEIDTPLITGEWSGSFLVSNLGEFSILNIWLKTDGTGFTHIDGSVLASTERKLYYYYSEDTNRNKFMIYVGVGNEPTRFRGFSLLNSDPDKVEFFTHAPFFHNPAGMGPLFTLASVDDPSGKLLAQEISPIDDESDLTLFSPSSGISIASFEDLPISSSSGKITLQDSETWHEVGSAGEPVFQNGWTNYGGDLAILAFRKLPTGEIHIKGVVKGGSANSVIFTLPSNYRPSERRIFPIDIAYGAHGRLTIRTNGEVLLESSGSSQTTYSSIEVKFYP